VSARAGEFENIIQHLEKVYQENMLESDVENPVNLIRVFLNGACYCDKKNTMSVWKLKGFIDLLKTYSKEPSHA
jgi:hypothetical protein